MSMGSGLGIAMSKSPENCWLLGMRERIQVLQVKSKLSCGKADFFQIARIGAEPLGAGVGGGRPNDLIEHRAEAGADYIHVLGLYLVGRRKIFVDQINQLASVCVNAARLPHENLIPG